MKKKLSEKKTKLAKAKENIFRRNEQLTAEVVDLGLCQAREDVEVLLTKCHTKKDKVLALQKQLNFRKYVLKQPVSDPSLFKFSSKSEGQYSVEKLSNKFLGTGQLLCSAH